MAISELIENLLSFWPHGLKVEQSGVWKSDSPEAFLYVVRQPIGLQTTY